MNYSLLYNQHYFYLKITEIKSRKFNQFLKWLRESVGDLLINWSLHVIKRRCLQDYRHRTAYASSCKNNQEQSVNDQRSILPLFSYLTKDK